MATPLLVTKLYIPPVRPRERVVPRPRLIEQLNDGLTGHSRRFTRKLTLISAPADLEHRCDSTFLIRPLMSVLPHRPFA